MVALTALAVASASLALVAAHPHPHASETRSAPLPGRWYHEEDHPVHALFRRAPTNSKRADPSPSVGSDAWTAQYPASSADPSKLPQAWVNALNDAVKAGKIPDIPPSVSENGGVPNYPAGTNENRNDPSICAATDRECRIPQDIWDGVDGYFAVGFDDGPTTFSPPLYTFLQQNNVTATHYMIGTNILQNWKEFQIAYNQLHDDIAVHTWTHPYMTTMTNEQVLGELAWTIQIIHDSTGGKIPRFWRPPYGDTDARVSAIAREVLGMTAVLWNQDTDDWAMGSNPPGTNLDKIQSQFEGWLSGPKHPGLIVLEHELYESTVQAFMNAFPLIGQNGWKLISQAQLNNANPYQDGKEANAAFNSLIPSSTSSASATPTSAGSKASGTASSGSGSGSPSSGVTAQSHSSGTSPTFLFPSLVSLGLLVGGVFALL
ncbi:glycoside hydrolase/deacetylase [Fomitiporia mediterranea MF3/22]|uniref:glycoside hydrolase/deacetylase n=1 Tax=Fomitiporia mediterranea (strain MF3/22) TaxID=694068 RepID=UPI000440830C|nr:glycoside hydrolase/deacetylase [Fomitiporia mediterranea MF3/22]EJD01510.1 glycoside hydrolase/deacetylase [Fomitiporia mediterranea MF3/22]